MGAIEILKKQGGFRLIKQYLESRVFFTALSQFLLLGKSRTALEILRLSTQLKTTEKLRKEYGTYLKSFDRGFDEQLQHNQSDKVWICWLQGIDNAPKVVRSCYESVRRNLGENNVILITNENMDDYVQLPEFILSKWEQGIITDTHLTDILRLELLIRYGGMWLDATVFCSCKRNNIPSYFFDSDLFLYQSLKPGRDGHSHINSSWLISAKTNNKILMATRYLLYEYWKTHNNMVNYFLLHEFMAIVSDYYHDEWIKIPPRDNATPHILLLRLFDQYDERIWQMIKEQTPFHKLSYKNMDESLKYQNTYYDVIVNSKDYQSQSK